MRTRASGDWLTLSCPICDIDYVGSLGEAIVAMAWRANAELMREDSRESARVLAICANAYGNLRDAAWDEQMRS
jgi:hypothetical protein